MIKVTFPDGSVREYAQGITAYQVAESISPRLAAETLAASVTGKFTFNAAVRSRLYVEFHKWDDEEGKHAFWAASLT